jgi:hypothetical protein
MRLLITLLLLLPFTVSAQLITRAQLIPVSNYIANVEFNALFGSNYLFGLIGGLGGTNQLIQIGGANLGSAGTVNWTTGVTGYMAGVVANLGVNLSGGSGEANVGANLGSGLNTYDSKSGVTLRFNTFSNGGDGLTIASNLNLLTANADWSKIASQTNLNSASNVLRTDITTLQSKTNFNVTSHLMLHSSNNIYVGSAGVSARLLRYDNVAGAFKQFFSSATPAIQWGTNADQHFFAGDIVDPDLDNTTVLGQVNRRWKDGAFVGLFTNNSGSISVDTNLTVMGKPGASAGILNILSTNGNSGIKLTVPINASTTNELVFDPSVFVVGQLLKVHSVSGQRVVLTNDTDSTVSVTTNANQFGASVQLTIRKNPLFTNVILYAAATNETNLIINQNIGQLVPMMAIKDSNGAPLVQIDNSGFLVTTQSITTHGGPSPTNTLVQGVENYAGRLLPGWVGQFGLLDSPQPAFFKNRISMIYAQGPSVGNFGTLAVAVGGASISHPTPDNFQPYMSDYATAASSNAVAGVFSNFNLATAGPQSGNVQMAGYFFSAEWSITNNLSGIVGAGASRTFVGLTSTASPDLTNIVNTTNATGQYAGLMHDGPQSLNMFITVRDAAAEFRTNTGINFVATNLYRFYLFQAPTSRFLNWRLQDLTANLSANGWFSNNVPTNFMKYGIQTKNLTNRAHSVRFTKLYLEAPLVPQ